ncbi:MAG: Do family serine endopeptidase [Pseudodesulfovibrio sp.]|uniref:Probable periplasmic serine endoprotease DegP-like n=1 Tax=Pseudodesulfovibrio aespoeensis (strain ATCC 700646 / DSM 10631 / Aspo-2) TaxID=643562 RepID=E6VRW6_PSEA9|nr:MULTISPECIES: Do family serine endopeptidase [Pseudodesulfovibrio]MBU4192977.1 Do family serine endopeptidase [Pseudomonadota bacterium]ADU61899.1 protease Do [Pseudodesulfovibrio aespoeensis Aspo-2]MBU4244275.1 Do family serine endopeptidase [Pseudomonadota bacterium]MBU4476386.1 Do family serine endopeptidase [Pseudomonadota bacterium]MBU4514852.1 Do family serine endopeptidase [Pseudomonadota bacterium]
MHRHLAKIIIVTGLVLALPLMARANGLPVFTELAARGGKSVVFISTEKTTQAAPGGQQFRQQVPEGHPFREFFDRFDQFFGQQPGQPRKQMGQGSGFVISANGLIVTNNHVIEDADKVTVRFQDDAKEYVAKVVGRDKETDLAVIKIDTDRTLPVLAFGDSDALQVGEWVLAIGNPFGLDNTVTAGIISAKHRIIGAGPFDNFLQTDASINPGNSGGPLLNMRGEVVGINTAINAAADNIGFAIPSTQAEKIIAQLKEGKAVKRGWIGVTIQSLDENQAKALGLPEAKGALISSVGQGHPADKAGIRQGDVVLEVDGNPVNDSKELLARIAGLKPGDKARLTLWRGNKRITKTVTLGERGEKIMAAMQPPQPGAQAHVLGMALQPVGQREANALGLDQPQGLIVVEIKPDSPAANEGVRQGDVILQANQQDVNSPAELEGVISRDKARGAVMLLIKRQGQNLFVALPLDTE